MTLEEFAKLAGVTVIDCDEGKWGGAFGYKERGSNSSVCGCESPDHCYRSWLERSFGEDASKAIISMLKPPSPVGFALTEDELKLCAELPDALVAIADYHDSKASMAAAMGYRESTDHHSARAEELKAEAKRIEATW